MLVANEKVTDFFAALNLGLEKILEAGEKLSKMVDENPGVINEILFDGQCPPWVTYETLRTVEAIGRGEIAPQTLILPMHVLSRLSSLPVDDQIKAIEGVEVANPPRNGKGPWRKCVKPAHQLTPREAQRAIGRDRIRSGDEQIGLLERGQGKIVGKYRLIWENGSEPRLTTIGVGQIADYKKQRVKVENGIALVEVYF